MPVFQGGNRLRKAKQLAQDRVRKHRFKSPLWSFNSRPHCSLWISYNKTYPSSWMYLWNKVEKHLLLHLYETSPFHTCHFSLPTFARLGGSEARSHSGGMSRPRCFPLRWAVLWPVRTACRIPVFELIQTHASWPAKCLNQRRPSFLVPLEWWESLGSLKKLRKGVPGRVQFTCDPSTKRQPHLDHGSLQSSSCAYGMGSYIQCWNFFLQWSILKFFHINTLEVQNAVLLLGVWCHVLSLVYRILFVGCLGCFPTLMRDKAPCAEYVCDFLVISLNCWVIEYEYII